MDDEPDVREMLKLLLAIHYDVVCASHGREALEQLKKHHFDGVVLDLMMPVLDGAGLIAEMRKLDIQVPILLMSAAQDLRAQADTLGVAAVCAKPCDPEKLEAELARLVAT